jgi:cAMP phosphodiesterase
MKSFFENGVYDEISTRINTLNENTTSKWGKMNVSQMLNHCQVPLNVILEKKDYNLKPNWLINLLFKKAMYSDKPWRKNMPTAKGFAVTDKKDFKVEKETLDTLLQELNSLTERNEWQPHPAFGKLTKDQWGKMQYKHLDHHLRQFGV